MKYDAYYNTSIQVVYLAEPGEPAPAGFIPLSYIEHCAINDIVGQHGYHALFSHVQKDLLEQAGLHNLVFWTIVDRYSFGPKTLPQDILDLIEFYKSLISDDYYLHTWIPLETAIYNIDPVLSQDHDMFRAYLISLYEALVLKVKDPCEYPFKSTDLIEYSDTPNQLTIDTKEFGVLRLDHEDDLAEDIKNQPELYEPRTDLYQGTGILTAGSNIYAVEMLIEELTDFSNIKYRIGASTHNYSKFLTLVVSRQYGFLSIRVFIDTENGSEYLTTIANPHFLQQPRIGIWYNQITQELGFTVANKHHVLPKFFEPEKTKLVGLSIEYLQDTDLNSTLAVEDHFRFLNWNNSTNWGDGLLWDVLTHPNVSPAADYIDFLSWDDGILWEDGYVWDVITSPYNNARVKLFKNTDDFVLAYPDGAIDFCGNLTKITQYSIDCLQKLYTATSKLNGTGFTAESSKAVSDARYEAYQFLNGFYKPQSEYLSIKQDLFDAVAGLRVNTLTNSVVSIDPVDRTQLIVKLELAHNKVPDKLSYTPCTWIQLEKWMGIGMGVLNDPLTTQFKVDRVIYWLDKTLAKLEKLVDRTDLVLLVESVEGLNKLDYTPQSWLLFINVLAEAECLIADPCNITKNDILSRLTSARDSLVLV